MSKEETQVEKKILEAARREFETKGYNGARMQRIAEAAAISKPSLHYYFRSKDQLFGRIFEEALDEYIPLVSTWSDDSLGWEEKVRLFTTQLVDFIKGGRMLFLIREINRNPELLSERIKKAKTPNRFVVYFGKLVENDAIRRVDPRFLYLFLNSICCFPELNKPMFQKALRMNPKQYDDLMEEFARAAAEFFIQAIKKEG